jgi:hypothetical protein
MGASKRESFVGTNTDGLKLIPPPEADRKSLERFVTSNPELEELESVLSEFNFFEAVGAVYSELRHSNFLAFLLNPKETHGLTDGFLKPFLKRVCTIAGPGSQLSSVEVDVWDPAAIDVKREWEGVDIILVHQLKKTVCWIENKIGAKEHSDQLARYYKMVGESFPGFKRFPIYLTPDGSLPSHGAYVPVDYGLIAEILKELDVRLESKKYAINPDVRVAIRHYGEMLRRHIMVDSKVAELALEIYKKHSRALDIIFEHRPDLQLSIFENLKHLIEARSELKLDRCIKSYIRFCASSWDSNQDFLKGAIGSDMWTPTRRIILFEFRNAEDWLNLHLVIGPGDAETRKHLFSACQSEKSIFRGVRRELSEKWASVWKMPFLKQSDYERHPNPDVRALISMRWSDFLGREFPKIEAAISKILGQGREHV